ncbi:hypothetical protein [Bacillus sp. UMB0728]|uniref:hypothetical protein n=1 Tax=Bacillus sp. UMB0728 TaxID=2066052 RepID=UPI000C755B3D|nr:hypothetical protein [Bacillus sp. UMB0728]PLR70455.1 hypothetical protein CYJ37_23245 [Bacillus sp. UMB0728]
MRRDIKNVSLQQPLNIPISFYEELKKLKGKNTLGAAVVEGLLLYKSNPVKIEMFPAPEKNKELYKTKYKLFHTSFSISITALEEIDNLFPDLEMNTVINNLLYLYCQSIDPSFKYDYFDRDYFQKEFEFNLEDYLAAYRISKSHSKGIPTQRIYDKNRLIDHPTLYNIRKAYNSFSEFVDEMERILKGAFF